MATITGAVVQMGSTSDKAANLARAEKLIRAAAGRGAQFVALPEMFNWRGKRNEERAAAQDLSGPTLSLAARLAAELQIHLLAGSIAERIDGYDKNYNTSVLFGPDGSRLAVYRKIHLFDVELPNGLTIRESAVKEAGDRIVVAETSIGRMGLTVCYDVRFPELYRALASAGAQLVTVPSAFTFPTGEAHWEVLLRARAIENQVFVVAPGQFGHNVHGFNDYGNSMIIDPWGRVLARMGDVEGVALAEMDFGYLERVRTELPCLEHRRLPQVEDQRNRAEDLRNKVELRH
jgi:predicted amidohydrolase